MGRTCSTHWVYEIYIQNVVGKPQRMRPLEGPRCRWVIREIKFGVWIGFIWLRMVTGGGLL
jgi:hypothetical protein